MKTIITTLPIYDKLNKQCFERGKHAGGDTPTPIICPRHRLPSFQWLDGTDGAASVSKIELMGSGNFSQDLFTHWVNTTFDSFTSTGLDILDAVRTSGGITQLYNGALFYHYITGENIITVSGNFHLISGAAPSIHIYEGVVTTLNTAFVEGMNTFSYTSTAAGPVQLNVQIGGSGAGEFSFTGVSFTGVSTAIDITTNFTLPTMIPLAHDYFVYSGTTLLSLLPVGLYYLKITMNNGFFYYSDWFQVDCVYENLITSPNAGATYDTMTVSGTSILSAINLAGAAIANSNAFAVTAGDVIKLITYLTKTSGEIPSVHIENYSGVSIISNTVALTEGLNFITLTVTVSATAKLKFSNTAAASWSASEILVIREYSEKYLIINFHNDCDLGDVYYHGGFTQSVYLPSEPMEPSFPIEEEGVKNGEGQFIRTFARQVKKYLLRTKEMPDYMVDVFNRMKLCDSIQLIDLVGDVHDVYNLEVEHEWLGTDKYYAKIDLTFDYNEAVVISGCCNNFT